MTTVDMHVHSHFCDGRNTPRELVLCAIEKGIKKLGILAHCYLEFEPIYCLLPEKKVDFLQCINELKIEFKDKIQLLCGIEQDVFSTQSTDGFDYVIGSVHFCHINGKYYPVDHTEELLIKAINEGFNGDAIAVCENYFDQVGRLADKKMPDIIGHFDLVTKFNENDKYFDTSCERYKKAWQKAVDKLVKKGATFEINTGAISRGYRTKPYPRAEIIDYIKKAGGKFVLSSDAHDGNNIGFEFDKWQTLL